MDRRDRYGTDVGRPSFLVVVMGADIARQCMRKRLLDELHIHLVPVLPVQGIWLSEHLGHDPIELERTHLTFRAKGKGE